MATTSDDQVRADFLGAPVQSTLSECPARGRRSSALFNVSYDLQSSDASGCGVAHFSHRPYLLRCYAEAAAAAGAAVQCANLVVSFAFAGATALFPSAASRVQPAQPPPPPSPRGALCLCISVHAYMAETTETLRAAVTLVRPFVVRRVSYRKSAGGRL